MTATKTPAQIAAEAAEAARITAAQAAEANEIALLESITHIKDFETQTKGNRFQADRLKVRTSGARVSMLSKPFADCPARFQPHKFARV